jgi:hypothetical protein
MLQIEAEAVVARFDAELAKSPEKIEGGALFASEVVRPHPKLHALSLQFSQFLGVRVLDGF